MESLRDDFFYFTFNFFYIFVYLWFFAEDQHLSHKGQLHFIELITKFTFCEHRVEQSEWQAGNYSSNQETNDSFERAAQMTALYVPEAGINQKLF